MQKKILEKKNWHCWNSVWCNITSTVSNWFWFFISVCVGHFYIFKTQTVTKFKIHSYLRSYWSRKFKEVHLIPFHRNLKKISFFRCYNIYLYESKTLLKICYNNKEMLFLFSTYANKINWFSLELICFP